MKVVIPVDIATLATTAIPTCANCWTIIAINGITTLISIFKEIQTRRNWTKIILTLCEINEVWMNEERNQIEHISIYYNILIVFFLVKFIFWFVFLSGYFKLYYDRCAWHFIFFNIVGAWCFITGTNYIISSFVFIVFLLLLYSFNLCDIILLNRIWEINIVIFLKTLWFVMWLLKLLNFQII